MTRAFPRTWSKKNLERFFDWQIARDYERCLPERIVGQAEAKRPEVIEKASQIKLYPGQIPFVRVYSRRILALDLQMLIIWRFGSVGKLHEKVSESSLLVDFIKIPEDVYYIYAPDTGSFKDPRTYPVQNRSVVLLGRRGLIAEELCAFTLYSKTLEKQNLAAVSSRYNQVMSPVIWLNLNDRFKLAPEMRMVGTDLLPKNSMATCAVILNQEGGEGGERDQGK